MKKSIVGYIFIIFSCSSLWATQPRLEISSFYHPVPFGLHKNERQISGPVLTLEDLGPEQNELIEKIRAVLQQKALAAYEELIESYNEVQKNPIDENNVRYQRACQRHMEIQAVLSNEFLRLVQVHDHLSLKIVRLARKKNREELGVFLEQLGGVEEGAEQAPLSYKEEQERIALLDRRLQEYKQQAHNQKEPVGALQKVDTNDFKDFAAFKLPVDRVIYFISYFVVGSICYALYTSGHI